MTSAFIKALSLMTVLGFSVNAFADARIEQVWSCTLKEGKSIEDVKVLNSKWVAYVNKAVKGGDIRSYVVTPIVGNLGTFVFVDSFPNMESWAAKKAVMETDEGKKIDESFADVSECQKNSLYSAEQS
ncbi:hypothetical protein [Thalassomonas sp. M1454]|uniref:hypothetical protein n=1 Tax=Thalassomonas sp. M1454 TaxID=2594477 RepID=UPI00117CB30C|nr:hypothetical protein [Thalassomonas sp. M1454]TRX56592.1 hypothetical protein FNN08_03415 [Thalassomonas sp. M1454]